MIIAITGASSFIGLKLVENLIKDSSNKVIAVVRRDSKELTSMQHKYSNLFIEHLEMEQYSNLGKITGNIDCLIYLSWNGTRGNERNNAELQKQNYKYGIQAIKSVLSIGCKKIITAGSQAEYGSWTLKRKITEIDIESPNTAYGKEKLRFYRDVLTIASKTRTQIIEPRFFSLYGPYDYGGTMVISILKNMLEDRPCNLTKCIQTWDFLYIDDAVRGIIRLLEDDVESGVYNFGSGESHPLKWYVEKMAEITGTKSKLKWGAIPYPKTGMVNVNPSVEKLKSLGWQPEVLFEEGIRNIVDLLRGER